MIEFQAPVRRALLLAIFLSGITAQAGGGPPLLTDGPGTPGDGHWEINLSIDSQLSQDERHFLTPLVDAAYGWGDRLQLKYQVPWVMVADSQRYYSRLSTSLFGVKWRFFESENGVFRMSTYPQFGFQGLGNPPPTDPGQSNFLAPVEIQEVLGDFEFNEEVGYFVIDQGLPQYLYGFALSYHLSNRVALLGEVHGYAWTDWHDSETVFNLGSQIDFCDRFGLLISAGSTLHPFYGDAYSFFSYTGLQIRL